MAISFPSNPTVGQQYTDTAANITWEWNGSSWASLPPSSSSGIGLTSLSVTQSAVGTAALSYNNSSGAFSYTPPDLSSYLTAESDTLADVTSRGATTNQTISFSASSNGISMDTASNNAFRIYGLNNQKAYITHAQNNGAGGAGDLVVIAKNGLHVYGGTSESTANLGLEVTSGFSHLLYQGNSKLTTTNTGINVTGNVETDTLNVSGISTFENNVRLQDNVELCLGNSNDLKISHSNFNRIVSTGVLTIDSDNNINLDVDDTVNIRGGPGSNETIAKFVTNGPVDLYYDNSKKFETYSNGVAVNGNVIASNNISGVSFSGNGANITGISTLNIVNYSGGSGGGLSSRSVVSATTGSVSVGATTNLNITGFKSYGLLKIGTNAASWVRLYVDDASRTSDANRSYLEDPLPGSGLIAEARSVSSGSNSFIMSPGIIGWNNDSTTGSTIYLSVTNNETSSSAITVDLTVVKLED